MRLYFYQFTAYLVLIFQLHWWWFAVLSKARSERKMVLLASLVRHVFQAPQQEARVHVSPSNASLRAPTPPPHPHNTPWTSHNDISHSFPDCGGLWG